MVQQVPAKSELEVEAEQSATAVMPAGEAQSVCTVLLFAETLGIVMVRGGPTMRAARVAIQPT